MLLGGLGRWRYEVWSQEQEEAARQARAAEAAAAAAAAYRAKQEGLVDALRARPGIVVTDAVYGVGRLRLTGLRDPLATDPAPLIGEAGLTSEEVAWQWSPYQSPERTIAIQRAIRKLAPSDGLEIAKLLGRSAQVLVVGRTDGVGSPGYNLQLDYDRASFVINALVERGLSAELFQVRPILPNPGLSSPDPKLRRTELKVVTANRKGLRQGSRK